MKDNAVQEMQQGTICQIKCWSFESYMEKADPPNQQEWRTQSQFNKQSQRHFSYSEASFSCNRNVNPLDAKTQAFERNWRRITIREAMEIRGFKFFDEQGCGKLIFAQCAYCIVLSLYDRSNICGYEARMHALRRRGGQPIPVTVSGASSSKGTIICVQLPFGWYFPNIIFFEQCW